MSGEALFQVNRISCWASLDLRFATEFLESPFNTFFPKEVVFANSVLKKQHPIRILSVLMLIHVLQGSLLSKNKIHSCSCVAQKWKEKHNGSKLTCQNPSEIFHMLSTFLFSQPFLCHRGMHEDGRILYSKQQSHYYTRYKP